MKHGNRKMKYRSTFTLQSQDANHQNQYHFEASLTIPLYPFLQSPENDQHLVQHEIYHLQIALRTDE